MIRNRNDKFNHPPRSFISHGPQPSKFSNTHGNTLNNVNSFKIVHNNNNLVNPLNAYNKNNSKISKEINPPKSPMHPKKESIYNNFEINRAITREFDNTLNPADFGPVIYEPIVASEFDDNSDDIFQDFDKKSPDSDFDFTPSHRHHFPTRPSAFTPSKAAPFSFPKKSDNQRSSHFRPVYEQETCDLYTEDICLETDDYPSAEVLSSLRSEKHVSATLLADVKDQSADELVDGITASQERAYDFGHYYGNRREDTAASRDFASDGGFLCPSAIRYARPRRARNSKGEWKTVVNVDKFTQTVRMEKCHKPGGACSYVSHHYQAMCNQVYNYQRLLSWEEKRGLHMDIFKVPTCCTCHIQGYSFVFPPLGNKKGTTPATLSNSIRPEHVKHKNRFQTAPPFRNPLSDLNGGRNLDKPGKHRNTGPTRHLITNEIRRMDTVNEEEDKEDFFHSDTKSVGRSNSVGRSSTKSFDTKPTSVNYDYHPILKFFNGNL